MDVCENCQISGTPVFIGRSTCTLTLMVIDFDGDRLYFLIFSLLYMYSNDVETKMEAIMPPTHFHSQFAN